MITPTPEQLRAAAAHLAKAVAEHNANGHYAVSDAVSVLSLETREARAISILSGWRVWYLGGPEGAADAAWAAEAFRWRLLLAALWQEQEARRVPAGHPDRNKKYEPCTACGCPRRDCGCEQDAVYELVRELHAGTSPAPAAGA